MKNIERINCCLLFLVFTTFQILANSIEIKGIVVDESNTPLTGVSVIIKGTLVGTITNLDGEFTIQIPEKQGILVFSMIGFDIEEKVLQNNSTIKVVLKENTQLIEEVVVIGYGHQKKETITGSINSIASDEILRSPVSSVSNAIAGKLPGLTAMQRGGEPGKDGSSIKIRGVGTLNSGSESDPLILVDGVERTSMDMLDPNEIESFNILKDASATAVFGVRGANGVILITTKTGNEGKPKISLSSNLGFQQYTKMPELVNAYEWATLANEGVYNEKGEFATLPYSKEALEAYRNGLNPIIYPDVNWTDLLLKPYSLQQQYNINISGGTPIVKYFVSFGLLDQDGLFKEPTIEGVNFDINPNYKRYNLRTNFDVNVTKNLTANFKMGTIFTDANYPQTNTTLIFDYLLRSNPLGIPGIVGDKIVLGYNNDPLEGIRTFVNPLYELAKGGNQKINTSTYNMNLGLKYDLDFLTKGLSIRGMVAYDDYSSHTVHRPKDIPTYNIVVDNTYNEGYSLVQLQDEGAFGFEESFTSRFRNIYWEIATEYFKKIKKHNISGLLLYYQRKEDNPDFQYGVPKGLLGLVGRITYNYDNRYLAELNLGYNGSEQFAEGNRMGFFPAFSAAWRLSEEAFFPKNELVTYVKIRGSYGEVGNDKIGKDRFLYLPSVYTTNYQGYNFGIQGESRQLYSGSVEGKIGNPHVTWERARKSNIGLELKFFSSKFSFVGDYFIEKRDNILWDYGTIPAIVGTTSFPAANLGKVNNKGFELEAGWLDVKENITYWIKGTFSFVRNKIIYMDEPVRSSPYMMKTGYSVGQYKGYKAEGFINTQAELENIPTHSWGGNLWGKGELKFVDINGDGIVNTDDMIPIGYGPMPEITYGLNLGFEWKGFNFSALLQGVQNVSLYLNQSAINPLQFGSRSAQKWHMGRWTEERVKSGQEITYPRMLVQNDNSPSFVNGYSDFWIQDADYLRLKNLEIGYRYSSESLKKTGIESVRFYINGSNLLTFTDLKNFDPEAPSGAGTFYPQTKVYNIGLNINF